MTDQEQRLKKFDEALESKIRDVENLRDQSSKPADMGSARPFVCRNGNPFECKVFIVGFNPATPMTQNFTKFWKDGIFQYQDWHKAYEKKTRGNLEGEASS